MNRFTIRMNDRVREPRTINVHLRTTCSCVVCIINQVLNIGRCSIRQHSFTYDATGPLYPCVYTVWIPLFKRISASEPQSRCARRSVPRPAPPYFSSVLPAWYSHTKKREAITLKTHTKTIPLTCEWFCRAGVRVKFCAPIFHVFLFTSLILFGGSDEYDRKHIFKILWNSRKFFLIKVWWNIKLMKFSFPMGRCRKT